MTFIYLFFWLKKLTATDHPEKKQHARHGMRNERVGARWIEIQTCLFAGQDDKDTWG